MKQKRQKLLVEILLFIIFLVVAILVFSPISKKIDARILHYGQQLTENLEKATGLSFSYTSLSLSIFRRLEITGLSISDASTKDLLFTCELSSISYSLQDLLKGDVVGSIQNIVFKNGSFQFNKSKNQNILEKLQLLLVQKPDKQNKTSQKAHFSIHLHNINIDYNDSPIHAQAHLASAYFKIENTNITGSLDATMSLDTPINSLGTLSFGLVADTVFDTKTFLGSSKIRLQSINNDIFSIPGLSFVLTARNGLLNMDSIQNIHPFDFNSTLDFKSQDFSVSFICDRFQPLRWIEFKKKSLIPDNLKDLLLSGSASFTFSKGKDFAYNTDLKAKLPSRFYGGGSLDLFSQGTQDFINIDSATLETKIGKAFVSGTYDIKQNIPEGFISLQSIKIANAVPFSGDLYVQGQKDVYDILIPELNWGEASLSSVLVNIRGNYKDFNFSLSAYDTTGKLAVDGTFNYNTRSFIEFHSSLDSINLSTILVSSLNYYSQRDLSFLDLAKEYEVTTELYFSSDFTDLSFNVPRLILASSVKEGNYLLLSSTGTLHEIAFNDVSVFYKNQEVSGDIILSIPKTNGLLFSSNFLYNAIPYQIDGVFNDRVLSLSGSYNLIGFVLFDALKGVSGRLNLSGLPIPINTLLFSLDLETDFVYSSHENWKCTLDSIVLEPIGSFLPLNSRLLASGFLSPLGLFLNTVKISDQMSDLNGELSALYVAGHKPDFTMSIDLYLVDATKEEEIVLKGDLFNKNELYFEANTSLKKFPLSRIIKGQSETNKITMDGTLSGTVDALFATAHVEQASIKLGNFDLDSHGYVLLEDKKIVVSEAYGSWGGNTFSNLRANLSLDTFSGTSDAVYKTIFGKKEVSSTLSISLVSDKKEALSKASSLFNIPDSFSIEAVFSNTKWGDFSLNSPVSCLLKRQPGITELNIGRNEEIYGYLLDDGVFSLQATGSSPLIFSAQGSIKESSLSIDVQDVYSDISFLNSIIQSSSFNIHKGILKGQFIISGMLFDPEFSGDLQIFDLSFALPSFFSKKSDPCDINILAQGKTILVNPFTVPIGGGLCTISAEINFDRWVPQDISLSIKTSPKKELLVNVINPYVKAKAHISCDIQANYDFSRFEVVGNVGVEKGYIAVLLPQDQALNEETSSLLDIFAQVQFSIGQKVEFRWPLDSLPIIRGLVVAEKPLLIEYDSRSSSFSLKGEAILKGGEIFYLKRNFYLREGKLVLNENQNMFNPLLTVQAEIRERDADGSPVRIILKVNQQPLSSFTPILTSDPIKSEIEIMSLLQQVTLADTNRNTVLRDTILTASDVLTQISVFRNIENSLRDALNLDIFSIRTLLLQNAIFGSNNQNSSNSTMTIGNYFDNTTVYMGKYLGSAMYTDLLTHFSYYDPLSVAVGNTSKMVFGNLLIQPEVGLEVSTPLFLFRWAIKPMHPETFFVSDNALTLTWKFSY